MKPKDKTNYPNYYSVIPANVRYCQELSYFEIILYSEISALSNVLGFCYASNNYFAKLYNKAPETISRAIKKIENKGFISCVIEQDNGNLRKIYINQKAIDKNINTPIDENVNTPIDENVKHNTTSKNNTRFLKQRAREEEPKDTYNIQELFNRIYNRSK